MESHGIGRVSVCGNPHPGPLFIIRWRKPGKGEKPLRVRRGRHAASHENFLIESPELHRRIRDRPVVVVRFFDYDIRLIEDKTAKVTNSRGEYPLPDLVPPETLKLKIVRRIG